MSRREKLWHLFSLQNRKNSTTHLLSSSSSLLWNKDELNRLVNSSKTNTKTVLICLSIVTSGLVENKSTIYKVRCEDISGSICHFHLCWCVTLSRSSPAARLPDSSHRQVIFPVRAVVNRLHTVSPVFKLTYDGLWGCVQSWFHCQNPKPGWAELSLGAWQSGRPLVKPWSEVLVQGNATATGSVANWAWANKASFVTVTESKKHRDSLIYCSYPYCLFHYCSRWNVPLLQ